jgi:hypothetical protein
MAPVAEPPEQDQLGVEGAARSAASPERGAGLVLAVERHGDPADRARAVRGHDHHRTRRAVQQAVSHAAHDEAARGAVMGDADRDERGLFLLGQLVQAPPGERPGITRRRTTSGSSSSSIVCSAALRIAASSSASAAADAPLPGTSGAGENTVAATTSAPVASPRRRAKRTAAADALEPSKPAM